MFWKTLLQVAHLKPHANMLPIGNIFLCANFRAQGALNVDQFQARNWTPQKIYKKIC